LSAWLILLSLGLLWSCSTKKNTLTRRLYHNLTAHYNAYWNGNESFKEGQGELFKVIQDNYTQVLQVLNYGTQANATSINPYMDRAIEKASIVIQRHSMYFNNIEYVRWVDDSYLLIGKAYFYKHEYSLAKRTLDFIIKRYNNEPIAYSAMMWLANTYNQQGEWDKAQSLLDLIQSKIDKEAVPKDVVKMLPLIYADLYIKQVKYDQAIDYLERGADINTDKYMVTRIYFILGQLYQKKKDQEAAFDYYTQVVRRNPPYEMAFNAKINMATSYEVTTGNRKLITKQLEKMIKDVKNKDYLDQIYFALAQVALKDKDDTSAVNYLKLSVSQSVSNNYQKAISALTLADLYFSYPDYENSQAYYDSAMMFLPKDYPDYDLLRNKTTILTELVKNLRTVKDQDSLQMVAQMPEKERNALIEKIISDYVEAERKKEQEEAQRQRQITGATQDYTMKQNMDRLSGGQWYFYNPSTLSYGYNEFLKRWGNRKLEDLWRLTNKQIMSTFESGEELAKNDTIAADSLKSTDPKKRETYLQNLPLTQEQMKASTDMIIEALYKLGYIYKEGLKNYPEAIESFQKLIERYPDNVHLLESYYNLFKIYEEMGDQAMTEKYKTIILNDYPDSDYAKIIKDPNYNAVLIAQRNKAASLYEETYQAYINEQYRMVQIYSDEAIANYSDHADLIPKFKFLKALSKGKIEGIDSMAAGLQNIVTSYPDNEVTPLAQNILDQIKNKGLAPAVTGASSEKPAEEAAEGPSPYTYEPKALHFYILIVDGTKVNVNATKVKIADFNIKYYKLENLAISSILLNNKQQMITVSNFPDKEKAMAYYNAIINSDYVFTNIKQGDYLHFVVSGENYKTFYQIKNTDQYLKFFDKNYITGK
jgi:tetratricopeptide (TPR) repeat protein